MTLRDGMRALPANLAGVDAAAHLLRAAKLQLQLADGAYRMSSDRTGVAALTLLDTAMEAIRLAKADIDRALNELGVTA